MVTITTTIQAHNLEVENLIWDYASYWWFCCNCSERPLDKDINDLCYNCQHLSCRDCLQCEQTEPTEPTTRCRQRTRRRLLGSHLDEFLQIPTIAADDEESDEDGMVVRVLGVGSQPSFGESRTPAESDRRSEVDYMIVAERGQGLGAGVLLDESDYAPTPSLIARQNIYPTASLVPYFEDADALSVLAARALDTYVGKAASDWNSRSHSMAAYNMTPQPPLHAMTGLEQAARWRYEKIKVENNGVAKSHQNDCENYTAHLQDPGDFPLVWHHAILPSLVQKLKTNYMRERIGTDFTVPVLRSKDPKERKICIMTEKPASETVKSTISEHILALFPTQFRSTFTPESFSYRTGSVSRMNSVRGTSPPVISTIYVTPSTDFGIESLEWVILWELHLAWETMRAPQLLDPA